MIAFDEAHAAKHARSGSGHSRAGEAVLTLSRGLPLARVLYASATAATEIAHMGYLDRHVSGVSTLILTMMLNIVVQIDTLGAGHLLQNF